MRSKDLDEITKTLKKGENITKTGDGGYVTSPTDPLKDILTTEGDPDGDEWIRKGAKDGTLWVHSDGFSPFDAGTLSGGIFPGSTPEVATTLSGPLKLEDVEMDSLKIGGIDIKTLLGGIVSMKKCDFCASYDPYDSGSGGVCRGNVGGSSCREAAQAFLEYMKAQGRGTQTRNVNVTHRGGGRKR